MSEMVKYKDSELLKRPNRTYECNTSGKLDIFDRLYIIMIDKNK